MRLDPKYFNLFIGICALLTLLAIVWGTISYTQKQEREFRTNISEVQIDTLSFHSYSSADSLKVGNETGKPIIIQFWSTWSGKSMSINSFLDNYQSDNPELMVVAATVKDAEELIQEYIAEQNYNFYYVEGTPFFQKLLIPGVPSSILINRQGELFDTQVGDDTESLKLLLDNLIDGS